MSFFEFLGIIIIIAVLGDTVRDCIKEWKGQPTDSSDDDES